MSEYTEKVYNIFNNTGRILQIEYALENLNNSGLVVITKSNEKIVVVTGKNMTEKLEIFENQHIHKVSEKCYLAITGLPSDVDQLVYSIKELAGSLNSKFGKCSPDVLCRCFADKMQKLTQESGTRIYAFSAVFFGFENGIPLIYQTDSSAVFYPYRSISIGEKSIRVNKFLESANNDPIIVAVEGYLEAGDCNVNDMIVCYLENERELKYLNIHELEPIINDIMERK